MKKHSFTGRALRVAAASGIVLGVLAPTAAFAADYPNGGGGSDRRPVVAGQGARTTSNSSSLPFTGSDAAGMAVIGAGAALAGVVMVRHSRRGSRHRLRPGSFDISQRCGRRCRPQRRVCTGLRIAHWGARCPGARVRRVRGGEFVDPGRVVFVNENLGGHASMHLFLRDALAEVHPGLDARVRRCPAGRDPAPGVRDPAPGPRTARPRPAPAPTPARPERGRPAGSSGGWSRVARPARRPAHVHAEHRVAAAPGRSAPFPSVVSTDATCAAGCVPPPAPAPDPLHVVRRCGWRSCSSVRVYAAATLRRRAVRVGRGCRCGDAYGDRRRPDAGDPVRVDARSRARPPRCPTGCPRSRSSARPWTGKVDGGCCACSASTSAAVASSTS